MIHAMAIIGWVLLALSLAAFLALFAVPFLPVFAGYRAAWAVGLLIASEVLFWAGAGLAAPELLKNRKAIIERLFPKAPKGGPDA